MNALQVLLTICRRILLRTSFAVALGIGLPASTQASDQAELSSAPFPASDITAKMARRSGTTYMCLQCGMTKGISPTL